MVGDKEVLTVLLRKLLDETYRDGVILGGFPRTPVQVECLKLLVDKISPAARRVREHADGDPFPPADDSRDGAVRQRGHEHHQAARSRARDRRTQQEGRRDRYRGRRRSCARPICRKTSSGGGIRCSRSRRGRRSRHCGSCITITSSTPRGRSRRCRPTSSRSSNIRARWSWTRARSSGCATLPLAEELVVHGRQELVKRLDSYEFEHTALLSQIVELGQARSSCRSSPGMRCPGART